MFFLFRSTLLLPSLLVLLITQLGAQAVLPPVQEWHGESEQLIVGADDPWVTPAELSGFVTTPDYVATVAWLKKLTDASPLLSMVSIGKSVENRDIWMVIASSDEDVSADALKASDKPLLLAQAGIHAGEIDGKDAGMMLLRDIAFNDKQSLLDEVNFAFVPILNVDGHEHSSPYNRPNQRGPENMGWRTNARNLNLNRDYAKLDTREVQAVVEVINAYDPLLYVDIHVTDGADYQYDVTFSGGEVQGNSPAIAHWLETRFKPTVDGDLSAAGHIPGPLLFALNDRDFTEGNISVAFSPRFSDSYGILRHLSSILVENHSLKPYKQRVLGTYVFLESTLELLAAEGESLREATEKDMAIRADSLPLSYKVPQMNNQAGFGSLSELERAQQTTPPDSMLLLGIDSRLRISEITNAEYIEWLGTPVRETIAHFKETEPVNFVTRPKGYWIPVSNMEVIERLKNHGIEMKVLDTSRTVEVEMYRMKNAFFGGDSLRPRPFEGRMQVSALPQVEIRQQVFPAGSVYVTMDQPLGDLALLLLEPKSEDSFFSWGFFLNIFQRTEYIEAYVMEPLAKRMLEASPALRKEFEEKKLSDPAFAANPYAIRSWFYAKTDYYDDRYLLYPVGREM